MGPLRVIPVRTEVSLPQPLVQLRYILHAANVHRRLLYSLCDPTCDASTPACTSPLAGFNVATISQALATYNCRPSTPLLVQVPVPHCVAGQHHVFLILRHAGESVLDGRL